MNKYRIAKHVQKDGGAHYTIECQSPNNVHFWKWYEVPDLDCFRMQSLAEARENLERLRHIAATRDARQVVKVEYIDE